VFVGVLFKLLVPEISGVVSLILCLPKRCLLLYLRRYHLGNSVGSLMLLLVAPAANAIGSLNSTNPTIGSLTTTLLKVVFPVLVTANVYVIDRLYSRT
jgi:hypothetical protein